VLHAYSDHSKSRRVFGEPTREYRDCGEITGWMVGEGTVGLAETIGDGITNMIVYAVIDIAVYFADTF
jgi:hypothetical protein